MKFKILHLFNHRTFVDQFIYNVNEINFENRFIFLNNENTYSGVNSKLINHVVPYSKEYKELITSCSQFDFLFLYDLDKPKIDFVNELKKNKPIIIWIFFGADLYSLPELKKGLFSDSTRALVNLKRGINIAHYLKPIVRPVYQLLFKKKSLPIARKKAIAKIDLFANYGIEEYEYLNRRLKNSLPEFIEYFISANFKTIQYTTDKSNAILIGNSTSPYNNHIDIIRQLENLNYDGKVTIPFSYGSQKIYIERIKQVIKNSSLKISLLEDFLQIEDYIALISGHSAAVFNSYRQMAMGNIFIALCAGVKVYLSQKNPSLPWFKRKEFKIFTVEDDLEEDIKKHNILLNEYEMKANQNAFNKLASDGINFQFLTKIKELSKKKLL